MSDRAGFVPLEGRDLQDPGRLNAELRFLYDRVAAIEGLAARYRFLRPFTAEQISLYRDRTPEKDEELITYGAAKRLSTSLIEKTIAVEPVDIVDDSEVWLNGIQVTY